MASPDPMPSRFCHCRLELMFCRSPFLLKLGLCRPIKNIRFINGEGRSAGRRCQSPERSGAEGRGSEHGAVLGMRRAELHKRDCQEEPTGARDFAVKRM